MKSNFAIIDRAVTDAMAHEPQLTEAEHRKAKAVGEVNVVGLHFCDDNKIIAEADRLLDRRTVAGKRFLAARTTLAATLAERDIVPLAIIPVPLWDKLCRESGLIQLCPKNGKVKVNTGKLLDGSGLSFLTFLFSMLLWSPAAIFMAAFTFGGAYGETHTLLFPLVWGGLWGIGTLLGCGIGLGNFDWVRRILIRVYARTIRTSRFVRAVFPDGHETDVHDAEPGEVQEATLVLPSPPPDVIAITLRATSFPGHQPLALQIAAVPEAIGFAESYTTLLLQTQATRNARRPRACDPIVYSTDPSNCAVAVLAQYCEFPIEQAVVDLVLGAGLEF